MQLPLLQGLIKRDPESYRDEFVLQKNHLEAELQLLQLKPSKDSHRLVELLDFVSHTVVCYKEDAEEFLTKLYGLLEAHAFALQPNIRLKIFQSLVLVKNKIQSDPLILIKLSFKLFALNDKQFRIYLSQFLFNDIKTLSKTKFNPVYHRAIQTFLYRFVSEETSVLVSQKTVELLSELYRHKIWSDTKTVNMIASAIYNPSYRVYMTAINFFLGIEQQITEDEDDEKVKIEKKKIDMNLHEHSKKTRKRERLAEKQKLKLVKLNKELEKLKNGDLVKTAQPLLPAIMVINDPQELGEFLFKKLKSQYEKFEHKLVMMNFLSQLIGCHKLVLLPFYSFLLKYITSHQQYVTQIFVYLVQSCHDYIPPEDILPIIKTIAYHFITERSTDENIALGINTVRELFVRIPAVLLEEEIKDLVQDLILYTHKTKKCVMAAARSLLNYIRENHPGLLRGRDRGKGADIERVPLAYGQTKLVDSADLFKALAETGSDGEEDGEDDDDEEEEEEMEGSDEEGEWEEMEEGEDGGEGAEEGDEDDEGEWVEVDDEGESGEEGEEGDWESVEEGEGESDEDSDDEEEEGEEEDEEEVEEEQPARKASKTNKGDRHIRNRLDINKILNSDDMLMIQQMKALRRNAGSTSINGSIRGSVVQEDDDDDNDSEDSEGKPDYVLDASAIMPTGRAGKLSKIERIKHVLEGRDEKRFTSDHAGGLTNKEKLRKKNFMMVRKGKRSLLAKSRRSSSETRAAKSGQKDLFGRDKRKRRRT